MKELCVVVDISGSMYTLGKPMIVGSILQTLSFFENDNYDNKKFSLKKMKWDGNNQSLGTILENCSENLILILTDGYSLVDNCLNNRRIKEFIEEKKDVCFVVLCGGDSLNISSYKEFVRVNTVTADNILYAIDVLLNRNDCAIPIDEKQEGEDWE